MHKARNPHGLKVGQKLYYVSGLKIWPLEIDALGQERCYLKNGWHVDMATLLSPREFSMPWQFYTSVELAEVDLSREEDMEFLRKETILMYLREMSSADLAHFAGILREVKEKVESTEDV